MGKSKKSSYHGPALSGVVPNNPLPPDYKLPAPAPAPDVTLRNSTPAEGLANRPGVFPVLPGQTSPSPRLTEDQMGREVARLGAEVIQKVVEASKKYVGLVTYIREAGVSPKLASFELGRLGFARTRISEINRLAAAPDAVFSAFKAMEIGMKGALQLTRGTVEQLNKTIEVEAVVKTDMEAIVAGHEAEVSETAAKVAAPGGVTASVGGPGGVLVSGAAPAPAPAPDPIATATAKMNLAAKSLLLAAAAAGIRSKKWHLEGYEVTVSKLKKKKVAGKDFAPED